MKHEDVPAVPFRAWISFCGSPKEVEVYFYDVLAGASIRTVSYRDLDNPSDRVICSVSMVELTKEAVEAEILEGLREEVVRAEHSISRLQEAICEAKEHPLWVDDHADPPTAVPWSTSPRLLAWVASRHCTNDWIMGAYNFYEAEARKRGLIG